MHPSDPWPARDQHAPEDHEQNEAQMDDDCDVGEDAESHDGQNLRAGRRVGRAVKGQFH